MKFQRLLLVGCIAVCKCSNNARVNSQNSDSKIIEPLTELQKNAQLCTVPESDSGAGDLLEQPNEQAQSELNVCSLVIECMATKYGQIGGCSLLNQEIYTTLEMQTAAFRLSLQSGINSGAYDLFASVLGAIHLAPNGNDAAQTLFKDEITRAIHESSGQTLAGLLLAGPDIMMRHVDMFHSTIVYASQHDPELLELCLISIDKLEETFGQILKDALWTASDSCHECLNVLLNRLWSKLPGMPWKLDDQFLHTIVKDSKCVSAIIEMCNGRVHLFKKELSVMLVGASSGHYDSLAKLLAVIIGDVDHFGGAIGNAIEMASKGFFDCLELLLPETLKNAQRYDKNFGLALVHSSVGHHECLGLLLARIADRIDSFNDSIGKALVHASNGHSECLQLIVLQIQGNVSIFEDQIRSSLVYASYGHPKCLRMILLLFKYSQSIYDNGIGRALQHASYGHVECLQLILPLVQENVALYSYSIGKALENASKGHLACLELILPLIRANGEIFDNSIGWALQYASEGHPECLYVILPLVESDVEFFKDSISWALLYASYGHIQCMHLILPLVQSDVYCFERVIEVALVNVRRSKQSELVKVLEAMLNID